MADMARAVAAFPEDALRSRAEGFIEHSVSGPPRPLAHLGQSSLVIDRTGITFGDVKLSLAEIRSVTTERADTLQVGCGLSEPEVVERVVRGGPEAIDKLVGWGARFDRTRQGKLDLSREGGHSRARIVHAGGAATGAEIQRALGARGPAAADLRQLVTDLATLAVKALEEVHQSIEGLAALVIALHPEVTRKHRERKV